MKKILLLKSYRNWEPSNAWVKLAVDEICKKNNIVAEDEYWGVYQSLKFRTCNEIIDLLEKQDSLGEFKVCEIPDDYTDIAIRNYDDYEYLFYVKNGKMYDEYDELINKRRR